MKVFLNYIFIVIVTMTKQILVTLNDWELFFTVTLHF